jgi:hypothetical protein
MEETPFENREPFLAEIPVSEVFRAYVWNRFSYLFYVAESALNGS